MSGMFILIRMFRVLLNLACSESRDTSCVMLGSSGPPENAALDLA